MGDKSCSDTEIETGTADSAAVREKQFTPWSMWAAMAMLFVVASVSFIVCALLLVAYFSIKPLSGLEEFFAAGLPMTLAVCVLMLLCLVFQISRTADWRKAFGVDVFPAWRTWRRILPVGVLFAVVLSASICGIFGMQISLIRNHDPDAMLERLKSRPHTPSASELRIAHPLFDAEELEAQILYPLKFPFGNGIWSGRFLTYLAVLLLCALINELVFRGIGFAGYRRTGSVRRAVIITSLVNGALFFPIGIVWTVLLGWIRDRSGSLYCSIAASAFGIVVTLAAIYGIFVRGMPSF